MSKEILKDDLQSNSSCTAISPQEFGEIIRRERESRFLSHKEISKSTRIRENFIEAIERGDLHSLPNPVFIRGFVKSLCQLMKLDTEDILEKFDKMINLSYDASLVIPTLPKKKFPWFYVFMGFVSIAAVTAIPLLLRKVKLVKKDVPVNKPIGFEETVNLGSSKEFLKDINEEKVVSLKEQSKEKSENDSSLKTDIKEDAEEMSDVLLKDTEIKQEELLKKSNVDIKADTEKTLNLTIKAKEKTWVNIKVDEDKVDDLILNEGNKRAWSAQKGFKITIGNAGGVDIELNGKPLGPYGKSGKVVKLFISEKDLQ